MRPSASAIRLALYKVKRLVIFFSEMAVSTSWELMYTRQPCDLNVSSSVWNDWYSALDKRGFYNVVQSSSAYVVPLLLENGCTRCLKYLQRLESDWNLSYDQFVVRLSFSSYIQKNEDFDLVTLAHKIKKDINDCIVPTKTDHVAIYLDGLRQFIRTNVPKFEKLGIQKDRTRISGIVYQLTSECDDPKLADVCLMFGLKNYIQKNPTYGKIGDMIAYLLASYRVLQERPTRFGSQLNLSAAHVAVMREDYHALAALPYREEDLWQPGGMSDMLPVELSAFNASVCPSRASILTFIVCSIKTGLLDSVNGYVTWDTHACLRVRNIRLILMNLLSTGTLHSTTEVMLRGRCFFDLNANYCGATLCEKVNREENLLPMNCTTYVSAHTLSQVWQLHQMLYKESIPFNKPFAMDKLVTSDDEDKKRYKSLHMIRSTLTYEGTIDYIRKSLRPQHAHYCNKLADIGNSVLVPLTDERLLLRCGLFRGAFTWLSYTAGGVCGVISPHCLFNASDVYTFMSLLAMLDTEQCLKSFTMECVDAKRKLSGNGTHKRKQQ